MILAKVFSAHKGEDKTKVVLFRDGVRISRAYITARTYVVVSDRVCVEDLP